MSEERGSEHVVVVGVDGSHESTAALRWAAAYVEKCGGELHAVMAYDNRLGVGAEFVRLSPERVERESHQTLAHALRAALGEAGSKAVVQEVKHGNATEVLVDASRDADLLVVGNRGHGGFAGMLLGSVSENCVRHAHCSVLVVRTHR